MKKFYTILFVAVCLLGVASCGKKKKDPEPQPEENKEIKEVIEDFKNEVDLLGIDTEINLPTSYKGCDIKWTSSDTRIVSNKGKIIKRPKNIKDVAISGVFTKDGESETTELIFKIYPRNYDNVAREFSTLIPCEISENVDTIFTDFDGIYKVTWSSSNPELFNEKGEYTKPKEDTEITIRYRVSVDETHYKDYEEQVMVLGITPEERKDMVRDYLIMGPLSELNVDSDLVLPEVTPDTNVKLSWRSTDENIISSTGKVTRCVYERFCYLICHFEIKGVLQELKFKMSVAPLDISKMSEEEILQNWADSIAVPSLRRTTMTGYGDFVQSFNRLYFFNNILDERFQQIVPEGTYNRPGKKNKIGTQLIVVHDTANTGETANAKAHANFVNSDGCEVSFQYVVGNDGIYHMIPDDEVSWHAGDGHAQFGMLDSGIKATVRIPNITTTNDGYFAFNNVKSKLRIPEGALPGLTSIVDNGLLVEVGENGNYWLMDTYYNSGYGKICNSGGNQHSIGIESCVNKKGDYLLTVSNLANLVAQLLMENDLSLYRVMQHNNMSGKDCPHAIRVSDLWQAFIDEISCIKFFNEHFKDVKVIWTPSTDILGVDGRIKKNVTGHDDVRYSVTLKRADKVLFEKNYITKLIIK